MFKRIKLGMIGHRDMMVDINIKKGDNLSICGNVGQHSFGQIRDELMNIEILAEGWTVGKIAKLHQIWKDYHLNDCQAGSPAQRAWIAQNGIVKYDDILAQMPADILHDATELRNGKPYTYGTAWLRMDIPADVLDWLRAL